MNFKEYVPFLVVLGPAILCAVIALAPAVAQSMRWCLHTKQRLELVKEFLSHAAFYGGVFASLMQLRHGSSVYITICVMWFAVCVWGAVHVVRLLER